MWIGTTAGLLQYVDGEFRRVPEIDGAATGEIAGMIEDRAGRLWAYESREDGGLLVMRDGRFEVAPVHPAIRGRITALASDQYDNIWVGTTGSGLVRVHDGVATALTSRDGLLDDFVTALLVARDGTLWIGTQRGYSRFENGVLTGYPLAEPGETRGMVRSIAEGRDGSIWLGTDDLGLLHWQDGQLTQFATYAGAIDNLTDNTVSSIFIDREGTVWVGTEGGLDQFRVGGFLTFRPGVGLPVETPGALYWDSTGKLWVAPESGGLLRGLPGAFETVDPHDFAGIRFLAISPSHAGGIWLASTKGIILYRNGVVRRYTARDGLTGGWVQTVLEDRRGHVWAGTLAGGVHRLDAGRIKTVTTAGGLADNNVRCLLEDASGAIWVGTDGGVSRISGDSVASYYGEARWRGPSITAIHEDRRGRVWFGTFRGLARLIRGRFTFIDTQHGLPDDVIASITEDGDGNLWLGTSKGVVRVSADEAGAVTERRTSAVHVTTFGTLDGLRSAAPVWMAQPASLRSPDGRLWFSTPRGLAMFDPRHVPRNPVPPLVRVEEIIVDGKRVPLGSELVLPSRARRLEIRYTGLSLRVPQRVHFRHMLEGFDESWVDAGTARSVSYTNLHPGRYRFRVTASNDDGVWSEQGAALDLRVLPAFYETPWFYGLTALALAAAGWGAVRLRQRRLERRFSLVLAERTRMAREIHDTLLQGFTGLTLQLQAIAGLVTRAPERAKEHMERILSLADKTLVDARQAVWDMRTPELQTSSLAEALDDVARHAANGGAVDVRFRLTGAPRPLSPAAEMALFRIGQEAVANAVKHADARAVDVELAYEPRATRLIVRDDGRGFDVDDSYTARGGHWGLLGMRERADQIGARLTITSADGQGTEVTVIAPSR
jgi:signal transduction histidine kinase/ligand-binding sensor domain-containing protein